MIQARRVISQIALALALVAPAFAQGGVEPAGVAELVKQLEAKKASRRVAAAQKLGAMGQAAATAVPALQVALASRTTSLRKASARALGGIGPVAKPAVSALITLLEDRSRGVRLAAIEALGKIGPSARSAETALTKLTKGKDKLLREQATSALELVRAGPEATIPEGEWKDRLMKFPNSVEPLKNHVEFCERLALRQLTQAEIVGMKAHRAKSHLGNSEVRFDVDVSEGLKQPRLRLASAWKAFQAAREDAGAKSELKKAADSYRELQAPLLRKQEGVETERRQATHYKILEDLLLEAQEVYKACGKLPPKEAVVARLWLLAISEGEQYSKGCTRAQLENAERVVLKFSKAKAKAKVKDLLEECEKVIEKARSKRGLQSPELAEVLAEASKL